MPERYKNIKFGSLDEYIAPNKFRTVGDSMLHIPMGVTEFAVEVHMQYELKSKLSFKTPWHNVIYGCAHDKRDVMKKLNLTSEIKTAYLIDWVDKYLFLIELEDGQEVPVMYVQSEDVLNLLENCYRIPEQR